VTGVKKVKNEINIYEGQQVPVKKVPIWFEVRDLVKSFTGRDDELKHLHDALQSKGGQAVVSQITSISSLGGIGKSELARKYAYDYKKYYGDNVVWINAETQKSIRKSFQGLATQKLRIPITEKKDKKEQERDIKSIVEDVYKYFQKAESLFIFDNVEQYESIYEFLPSYFYLHSNHNKPHVLITSRNRDWKVEEEEEIKVIQLGILTQENAAQFIRKALKLEDKKDDLQETEIKQLSKELQYFPLALRQAISYIEGKKEDFELRGDKFEISDYLKEYENEAKKLLHFEPKNDRYTKTTFITWKITIENIKQKEHGQEALNVLEIMAYFAPDNVPIKTFFSEPVVEKSSWDAIKLLSQYSMINVEKGVSSIHRLVQHVIRLGLKNQSKEEEILEKALKLINSADIGENSLSHITSVWDYASKYGKLIDEFYLNSFYGRDKETPLHLLAENGHSKAIEGILIHMGKNGLNEMRKIIYTPDKSYFRLTPFQTAINNGYLGVIKVFLEKGADVKADDNDGRTPLYWAAIYGKLDVVKYLVEKGADVKAANKYGNTPLHKAAEKGHWDVVKYLVEEKGADVKAADKYGNTPLHLAAYNGKLDIVKYLVEEKGADVKAVNNDGNTPLHLAAYNGKLDVVKYIVEEKGADVKAVNNDGNTPLHLAAYNSELDVVKYIVEEKGADVKAVNNDGNTPLHLAAYNGKLDVVKYLVEKKGADVKAANNDGRTTLHWAARDGKLDVVKYLVEKGADVKAANNDGRTLLHLAAENGHFDVVKYLVEEKGAYVMAADKYGNTPLHLTAYNGKLDVVKYFVEENVAYVKAGDKYGNTPLHLTAYNGKLDVVKYLVGEKGADVKSANNDGDTLLHTAAYNGKLDVVKYLVEEKGADVKAANNDGRTPLHWAAENGHLDVVKYLVEEKCADVKAVNNDGWTPLHQAAGNGNLDIVKYLVGEKGADVKAANKYGSTPLHRAAENSYFDVLKYLVEKGADVNAANNVGDTPMKWAAYNSHWDVVKYLERRTKN
jgi:ankyrin repeat protein